VKDAFIIMRQLTSQIPTPLLFMAYYNTVFKYGVEKFCKNAQAAGASGLIVPDMPIDEESEEHFLFFCRKYDLHNIQVISPASTEDRLKKNAEVASGFVYCTARQGITGAKDQLDQNITTYIEKVKSFFSVPVAIGFGISKRQHIQALKPHADIAVIGSAIINIINKSNESDTKQKIKQFLLELKS